MKPIKPSRLPYQDLAQNWAWFRGNLSENEGMPQDPDIRAMIIVALTYRIKALDKSANKSLYRLCMQSIQTIANLEVLRYASPERRTAEIGKELARLIAGKPSRLTHYPLTIQQQRTALRDFFAQEKLDKKKNPADRIVGIKERWADIMELLTLLPCPCANYQKSYDEFNKLSEKDNVNQRNGLHRPVQTHSEMADLIIAYLHGMPFDKVHELANTHSS